MTKMHFFIDASEWGMLKNRLENCPKSILGMSIIKGNLPRFDAGEGPKDQYLGVGIDHGAKAVSHVINSSHEE